IRPCVFFRDGGTASRLRISRICAQLLPSGDVSRAVAERDYSCSWGTIFKLDFVSAGADDASRCRASGSSPAHWNSWFFTSLLDGDRWSVGRYEFVGAEWWSSRRRRKDVLYHPDDRHADFC